MPELLAKIHVLAERTNTWYMSVDSEVSKRMKKLVSRAMNEVYGRQVRRALGVFRATRFNSDADRIRMVNAIEAYEREIKKATEAPVSLDESLSPVGEKLVRNSGICGSEALDGQAYEGVTAREEKLRDERTRMERTASKEGPAAGSAAAP